MTRHIHSASPFESRYGFSRALREGSRIEVAGTAPIPQDGSTVPQAAFDQMLLCGSIAKAAIESLGGGRVIRTRMFIIDAGDADEIGRAHRQLFGTDDPVATMVVVRGLLDASWKVEIEVEAVATD